MKEFKDFILDDFQKKAIQSVRDNHSVIVSAPTGAGKTIIAEYVIKKCLDEGLSLIYTAPIKALSNQKFREFNELFPGEVGIITGDVNINPFALNGSYSGTITRVSDSQVINVSAGGGLVPTLTVSPLGTDAD